MIKVTKPHPCFRPRPIDAIENSSLSYAKLCGLVCRCPGWLGGLSRCQHRDRPPSHLQGKVCRTMACVAKYICTYFTRMFSFIKHHVCVVRHYL